MITTIMNNFPAGQNAILWARYASTVREFAIEIVREQNKVRQMGIISSVVLFGAGAVSALYLGGDLQKGAAEFSYEKQVNAVSELRIKELRDMYCKDKPQLTLEDCITTGLPQYLKR